MKPIGAVLVSLCLLLSIRDGRACDAVPRESCVAPLARGSTLLLGNHLRPRFLAARLVWRFSKGQTVTDFGDPITTTSYELCIYDYTQGVPELRANMDFLAAAGSLWSVTSEGFRYTGRSEDGLRHLSLGRRLFATAHGAQAWGLPFHSDPHVVVQLVGQGCWSATFSHSTRNVAGQYVATSSPSGAFVD